MLQECPLLLEYWRISPATSAVERVALTVSPLLSEVMKSVELMPESEMTELMLTVVVGAVVSTAKFLLALSDVASPGLLKVR